MAVSFQQALVMTHFQLATDAYYTVDIGEPPAGAQMLALFGTNSQRDNRIPQSEGHTYGGLPIVYLSGQFTPSQYNGKQYLLQSFAGKSGTTLSLRGGGAWNAFIAAWVMADGTVELVEDVADGDSSSCSVTHDPGAYAEYGTCGLYYKIGSFTTYGTKGGSQAPVTLGTRNSVDMGANTRLFHDLAALSGATTPGTFTHTLAGGATGVMSMLFGEGGQRRRLSQSIIIT